MKRSLFLCVALVALLLAACGGGTSTPSLNRDRASEIAWQALEPNTASHSRANWTVMEVQTVSGQNVAEEFEGWVYHAACGGPAPPPNSEIEPSQTYWFVELRPRPATPSGPSMSPTAPPLVPEPFIQRALILLDESGQVEARMLACVVY